MSRNIPDASLDAIAAAGFSVYQSPDAHWRTYAFFTDGTRIGYIQQAAFGGLEISTVHQPCRECGTGFGMGSLPDFTRESLSVAFAYAPDWAGQRDRDAVRKWPNMAALLASRSTASLERVRVGHLETETERKAAFRAEPMLEDFVAVALQDLQLRESDEACGEEREARDSGTIYTLRPDTFAALQEIVSRFRLECADHIAAALELEPGGPGLPYRRGSRTGCPITESELGGTLWLAVTGTGVTFTDDGNADCLEALATWARAQHCEGLYFGDAGDVHLI